MTINANDAMLIGRTLHEDAKAADRTVYTIQSLLSLCKHVADSTVEDAERSEGKAISGDLANCLNHAEKLLMEVGDFIERVSTLAKEKATEQRAENA